MRKSFGDFSKNFPKISKKIIPALARKGLGKAAMLILADAVQEVPKVPHDEGTLRGSGSAFVETELVGTTPSAGGNPTPARTNSRRGGRRKLLAVFGFNTPYAHRLHEHPEYNFVESGTGGQYLRVPMLTNKKSYLQEIADTIKEGGRKL